MTINTIGNGKDDVSIYNGDENHKVCLNTIIFFMCLKNESCRFGQVVKTIWMESTTFTHPLH